MSVLLVPLPMLEYDGVVNRSGNLENPAKTGNVYLFGNSEEKQGNREYSTNILET